MDKATPTPSPASVDSVMALADAYSLEAHRDGWKRDNGRSLNHHTAESRLRAEVERLAAQAAPPDTQGSAFGQLTREHAHSLWDTVSSIEWRNGAPVHVNYAYALLRRFGKPVEAARSPAQAPVQPGAVVPAPQTNQQGHQRAFLGLARAAERAPVVRAVQQCPRCEGHGTDPVPGMACCNRPTSTGECCGQPNPEPEPCETCEGRGQVPVQAVQAMDYPPLPEGVKARFKCEDCNGTGYTGDMIPGSEFQPPEPVGCTSCNFTGWWAECQAYSADQMHAYVDADRASSGATQAVAAITAQRDKALARATDWKRLYDRAINEANGLTNYVEDRPELRSAERRLDVIAADARALKGQP